jgi:Tol biopolymer transport system component
VALEEYFKIRRVGTASFSYDEKLVAYMSDEGGRPDVWVQPVGGGKPVLLTPHQGEVLYESHAFSHDGRSLYYTSDEGREFTTLRKMELASKKSETVLQAEWEVDAAGFSRGWKYFYTVTNVDGTPQVDVSKTATYKKAALPKLPGEGHGFSKNENRLLAYQATDRFLDRYVWGDASVAVLPGQ